SYVWSFHGPVPLGALSSVVPDVNALGVITVCGLSEDTRYGRLPLGLSRVKTMVWASVAVTEPDWMTPERPELPAFTSRSNVAMMSSVVSGVPSCHITPLRIVNVHTEPSLFGFHDSASPGVSCRLPSE